MVGKNQAPSMPPVCIQNLDQKQELKWRACQLQGQKLPLLTWADMFGLWEGKTMMDVCNILIDD